MNEANPRRCRRSSPKPRTRNGGCPARSSAARTASPARHLAEAGRLRRSVRRLLIPLLLVLGVLASRLPFVTNDLWAWDSVLYARALEQGFHVGFHLADQRPQAPGYLFY